ELLDGPPGGGAGEDPGTHRATVADVPGDGAGVDAADADDAVVDEGLPEVALGAPVGRARCRVADDEAGHPDPPGLHVGRVHPGVADVRGGHDDDLPVVGRVGEGLLVAGHPG